MAITKNTSTDGLECCNHPLSNPITVALPKTMKKNFERPVIRSRRRPAKPRCRLTKSSRFAAFLLRCCISEPPVSLLCGGQAEGYGFGSSTQRLPKEPDNP